MTPSRETTLMRYLDDIYKPVLDTETGEWKDHCPFQPRSRNNDTYRCCCMHTASFNTKVAFNTHIKSQCHQKYLRDYKYIIEEQEQREKNIKRLQSEKELSERLTIRLKRENEEAQTDIRTRRRTIKKAGLCVEKLRKSKSELEKRNQEFKKRNEELERRNQELEKRNEGLERRLQEFERRLQESYTDEEEVKEDDCFFDE